jgi:hypothetical protein
MHHRPDFNDMDKWTNIKDIIKECRQLISEKTVLNKHAFGRFVGSLLFFLIVFVVGLVNIFVIKNTTAAIVLCALSVFILYQYSLVGWFSSEHYFKYYLIFRKEYTGSNGAERHVKRVIYDTPAGYIGFMIVINFLNAISFSSQILYFFLESEPVIAEIGTLIVHLLLIPSFVKLFETLVATFKHTYKTVGADFIRQTDAMFDLFGDVKFAKNNIYAVFPEYELRSRRNIFFLDNEQFSQHDRDQINKLNQEILQEYQRIWNDFIIVMHFFNEMAKRMKNNPGRRRQRAHLPKASFFLNTIYDFLDYAA